MAAASAKPLLKMTVQELNHVALYVSDVERSSDFYARVLQLPPLARPAFTFPGAWFRLGTTQELHLIANHGEPFFRSHNKNHFALRVDDLDHWESHLKSVGADFFPRKPRPDGAWQVFLRDPDGHVIELFTPAA
jgi:lactoylglutathione lyase